MILEKVTLRTFGCFSQYAVEFQKGLNVILGANEAGKSTLFHAIQKTLLIPSKLKKLDFEKQMARFLPVGGGDTLEAQVEFWVGTARFVLVRSWGARPASRLVLPDGAVLNDENTLQEKVKTLLPAKPGTVRSVLMTYQSGLSMTIDDLKADPTGTLQTLGDILRKAILETDGVSIDQFKGRVDALYGRYFSHWDSKQDYPEKGKGIENPYVKEVGEILHSFYEKERISRSLKKAQDYEEKLDALNRQIEDLAGKVAEKEKYLQENKKPVEDARERWRHEAELKAVQTQIEMMKKANSEWPVSESKIKELKANLPSLEKKRGLLQDEKKQAEIEEGNKSLRETFRRVQLRKVALQEAQEKLASVKKLERSDLEEIRKASNFLHQTKAGLEAGRLSVLFRTRQDSDLIIQRDLDKEYSKKISKEEPLRLEAGGRLRLLHPEWKMEVTSGKINFREKQQKYHQAQELLRTLFDKHGINSLEQAVDANQTYESLTIEVKKASENLAAELGPETYEELESKMRAIGQEKTTRPIARVIEELAKLQYEIESVKKDLDHHQTIVTGYQEKYETADDLLLALAEAVRKEKTLIERMGQLAPLPEGAVSPEAFIKEYEGAQTDLDQMRERKNAVVLQRANLEREAPEASAEELAKALSEAEEQFKDVVRRGKAIEQIKMLTQKLLEKLDVGTFAGLKKDLEETVSHLTACRYSQIEMAGCLPEGFLRGDGKPLPYELLSQGTKDILSLALRLVMAEYFLKNADGFLMMDDPLVDLDPARQERAAEALRRFAEKKQLLLFTCHPFNAELLGGHLVRL
jgi:DNA repair protein SbcC/Rad50